MLDVGGSVEIHTTDKMNELLVLITIGMVALKIPSISSDVSDLFGFEISVKVPQV